MLCHRWGGVGWAKAFLVPFLGKVPLKNQVLPFNTGGGVLEDQVQYFFLRCLNSLGAQACLNLILNEIQYHFPVGHGEGRGSPYVFVTGVELHNQLQYMDRIPLVPNGCIHSILWEVLDLESQDVPG